MVWFLRRQPGEIKALIVIKNDAPTHHFTKLGTAWRDGYKSDRHRSADKLQSGFHHRMPFGESLMESIGGMNGIMEAAVNGAILGAGFAIWLVAGYLIPRFGFRNPEPNYATVIATSTGASMLLFSLVALLVFHMR